MKNQNFSANSKKIKIGREKTDNFLCENQKKRSWQRKIKISLRTAKKSRSAEKKQSIFSAKTKKSGYGRESNILQQNFERIVFMNQLVNYDLKLNDMKKGLLKKISGYPEGTLSIKNEKKGDKEYNSFFITYDEKDSRGRKKYEFITKDAELVETMVHKKFFQEMLLIVQNNINEISKIKNKIIDVSIDEVLKRMPCGMQNFLRLSEQNDWCVSDDPMKAKILLDWVNDAYVRDTKYPENLKHTTSKGLKVRSKSEALIYEKLMANKIANRYEAQLLLDGYAVYPDFTIMRTDNKIFYWEHAGCCYKEDYRKMFDWKYKLYEKNGIVLWDNLIVTFDDIYGNIDVRDIDSVIKNKLMIK